MKSLITPAIIIASLALSANAFAADSHVETNTTHARAATHVVVKHVAARHIAPRRHYAVAPRPVDIGQIIQSFFGGGFGVQLAHGSAGVSNATPSYDYSPPSDPSPTYNDAQAAADSSAEAAAIQSMNDTMALNASMAAAEQQNEAANAAALQTEINAGM
jgi:hypothetical protein